MYKHILFSRGKNLKIWRLAIVLLFTACAVNKFSRGNKLFVPTWGNQRGFYLELDRRFQNTAFFITVILISLIVFNWAGSYISSRFKPTIFFISLITFVRSMLLLIIRERFIILFLGWEGLGVSSFLLIIFYQNWIRMKGSLLTLLTNRLGDAIFIIVLCYWLSVYGRNIKTIERVYLLILILAVSSTKRAQWPFINWLPAAIAAPTPVRALVHRSTLVTAGVWLMVRFSQRIVLVRRTWLLLGITTLLVASLTALTEKDAKKVVALSTLSQLGIIFISLRLGNAIICLFHILIHALAKANLFIVVGELLHKRFTQQDIRYLVQRGLNKTLFLSKLIRIVRLTGLVFSSGFFSKEQIITRQYTEITRILSWILLVLVSGLTVAYCYNLLLNLSLINLNRNLYSPFQRKLRTISLFILSIITVTLGWIFNFNFSIYRVLYGRFYGWYWALLLSGLILVKINMISRIKTGFYRQNKIIDFIFLEGMYGWKSNRRKIESSRTEIIYLFARLEISILFKYSLRIIFICTCLMLILLGI